MATRPAKCCKACDYSVRYQLPDVLRQFQREISRMGNASNGSIDDFPLFIQHAPHAPQPRRKHRRHACAKRVVGRKPGLFRTWHGRLIRHKILDAGSSKLPAELSAS